MNATLCASPSQAKRSVAAQRIHLPAPKLRLKYLHNKRQRLRLRRGHAPVSTFTLIACNKFSVKWNGNTTGRECNRRIRVTRLLPLRTALHCTLRLVDFVKTNGRAKSDNLSLASSRTWTWTAVHFNGTWSRTIRCLLQLQLPHSALNLLAGQAGAQSNWYLLLYLVYDNAADLLHWYD